MADDITDMWTQTEIDYYKTTSQTRYVPLIELYAKRGLPEINPLARIQFLVNDVLYLSEDDKQLFNRIKRIEGLLTMMSILENYVATIHQTGRIQFPEQI